jgi:quercetin dioxygenase-like cupin family protein
MEKKYVVPLSKAVLKDMHGGSGTARILIDEEISGARNFTLMVNTLKAGAESPEHKHDAESGWYFLSGTGTIYIDGKQFKIGPQEAAFAPGNALHKLEAGPDEDLTYVIIYAPPGASK